LAPPRLRLVPSSPSSSCIPSSPSGSAPAFVSSTRGMCSELLRRSAFGACMHTCAYMHSDESSRGKSASTQRGASIRQHSHARAGKSTSIKAHTGRTHALPSPVLSFLALAQRGFIIPSPSGPAHAADSITSAPPSPCNPRPCAGVCRSRLTVACGTGDRTPREEPCTGQP